MCDCNKGYYPDYVGRDTAFEVMIACIRWFKYKHSVVLDVNLRWTPSGLTSAEEVVNSICAWYADQVVKDERNPKRKVNDTVLQQIKDLIRPKAQEFVSVHRALIAELETVRR